MPSTTIVPTGTLGNVPNASGQSNQSHLIFGVNSNRWFCFFVKASDTTHVQCFVSDNADLTVANWAAIGTGSASPVLVNSDTWIANEGRNLAVAYANISSTDVVYVTGGTSETGGGVNVIQTIRVTLTASVATWGSWLSGTGTTGNANTPDGSAIGISAAPRAFVLNSRATSNQDTSGTAATNTDAGSSWTSGWSAYANIDNSQAAQVHSGAVLNLASSIVMSIADNGSAANVCNNHRWANSSSATAWPNAGTAGANITATNTTATQDPNDWGAVGVSTTDVHFIRRNGATTFQHYRFNGSTWGAAVALPTTNLTGHVAGSGVFMATDNTSVWCFLIDSDANHSIKYAKWTSGGGWDSSWSTLSTNTNAKTFLSGSQDVGNQQINLIWMEGANPYSIVNGSLLPFGQILTATTSVTTAQSVTATASLQATASLSFIANLSNFVQVAHAAATSVTMGTQPVQGNLLVAFGFDSATTTPVVNAGWSTPTGSGTQTAGSGGTARACQVAYKLAGAGESTTQTPFSASSVMTTVVEYNGVYSAPGTVVYLLSAAGAAQSTGASTPAAGRELMVSFWGIRVAGVTNWSAETNGGINNVNERDDFGNNVAAAINAIADGELNTNGGTAFTASATSAGAANVTAKAFVPIRVLATSGANMGATASMSAVGAVPPINASLSATASLTTTQFITASASYETIWPFTQVGGTQSADSATYSLGTIFTANAPVTVDKLAFYVSDSGSGMIGGTTQVALYLNGNSTALSVATASVTGTGWIITSIPPVTLSVGSTYVAAYFTTGQFYAFNGSYFGTRYSDPRDDFTATSGAFVTGGTGVGLPTSTSASVYWVMPMTQVGSGGLSAIATMPMSPAVVARASLVATATMTALPPSTVGAILTATATMTAVANCQILLSNAQIGYARGPTGGPTQNHLLYAQNTNQWWFVCYGGGGSSDTGTATGGDNQHLTDTHKSWTTNQWTGFNCYITGGTGQGESFEIGTNTATSLRLQVNDDPATPYHLNFTPDATSTYVIIDTRNATAYVSSSSSPVSSWALGSGGRSANSQNNEALIDMPGGRWDGSGTTGGGEHPTDQRQIIVQYANVSSHDVITAFGQTGGHWFKEANRARLTGSSVIAWDNIQQNTNPWDDTQGAQEALPYFLQGMAYGFSQQSSRWHAIYVRTPGMVWGVWQQTDPGTGTANSIGVTWNGTTDPQTMDNAVANESGVQAALVEINSSGIMMAVYNNSGSGYTAGTWGLGQANQTGLRYRLSSSSSAWPTNSTGAAAVPNLSSASNSPNDWDIVQVSTTDIHVVRRNSATVLEHIRYDGSSWGSVVTLPSTGLTGHVANSGVTLTTDGANVWCFALDSDTDNTLRYVKWNQASGNWDSSWSSLPTNTDVKSFVVSAANTGSRKIGIAWSEGADPGPYKVLVSSLDVTPTAAQTMSATASMTEAVAVAASASLVATATMSATAFVPINQLMVATASIQTAQGVGTVSSTGSGGGISTGQGTSGAVSISATGSTSTAQAISAQATASSIGSTSTSQAVAARSTTTATASLSATDAVSSTASLSSNVSVTTTQAVANATTLSSSGSLSTSQTVSSAATTSSSGTTSTTQGVAAGANASSSGSLNGGSNPTGQSNLTATASLTTSSAVASASTASSTVSLATTQSVSARSTLTATATVSTVTAVAAASNTSATASLSATDAVSTAVSLSSSGSTATSQGVSAGATGSSSGTASGGAQGTGQATPTAAASLSTAQAVSAAATASSTATISTVAQVFKSATLSATTSLSATAAVAANASLTVSAVMTPTGQGAASGTASLTATASLSTAQAVATGATASASSSLSAGVQGNSTATLSAVASLSTTQGVSLSTTTSASGTLTFTISIATAAALTSNSSLSAVDLVSASASLSAVTSINVSVAVSVNVSLSATASLSATDQISTAVTLSSTGTTSTTQGVATGSNLSSHSSGSAGAQGIGQVSMAATASLTTSQAVASAATTNAIATMTLVGAVSKSATASDTTSLTAAGGPTCSASLTATVAMAVAGQGGTGSGATGSGSTGVSTGVAVAAGATTSASGGVSTTSAGYGNATLSASVSLATVSAVAAAGSTTATTGSAAGAAVAAAATTSSSANAQAQVQTQNSALLSSQVSIGTAQAVATDATAHSNTFCLGFVLVINVTLVATTAMVTDGSQSTTIGFATLVATVSINRTTSGILKPPWLLPSGGKIFLHAQAVSNINTAKAKVPR